jgi:hypothetical protein
MSWTSYSYNKGYNVSYNVWSILFYCYSGGTLLHVVLCFTGYITKELHGHLEEEPLSRSESRRSLGAPLFLFPSFCPMSQHCLLSHITSSCCCPCFRPCFRFHLTRRHASSNSFFLFVHPPAQAVRKFDADGDLLLIICPHVITLSLPCEPQHIVAYR